MARTYPNRPNPEQGGGPDEEQKSKVPPGRALAGKTKGRVKVQRRGNVGSDADGLKVERRKVKRSQAAVQRRRRGSTASLLSSAKVQEESRKVRPGAGIWSSLLGPSAGISLVGQ